MATKGSPAAPPTANDRRRAREQAQPARREPDKRYDTRPGESGREGGRRRKNSAAPGTTANERPIKRRKIVFNTGRAWQAQRDRRATWQTNLRAKRALRAPQGGGSGETPTRGTQRASRRRPAGAPATKRAAVPAGTGGPRQAADRPQPTKEDSGRAKCRRSGRESEAASPATPAREARARELPPQSRDALLRCERRRRRARRPQRRERRRSGASNCSINRRAGAPQRRNGRRSETTAGDPQRKAKGRAARGSAATVADGGSGAKTERVPGMGGRVKFQYRPTNTFKTKKQDQISKTN